MEATPPANLSGGSQVFHISCSESACLTDGVGPGIFVKAGLEKSEQLSEHNVTDMLKIHFI